MPVQGGTGTRAGAAGFECHKEGRVCVCVWNLQSAACVKRKDRHTHRKDRPGVRRANSKT